MKIAWFCIPAHGHTNPTLGLVKEMTEAGHQVYYFSFAPFREKIEQAGAVFIGCDGYGFEMEDKENVDRVGKDMAFAAELLVSSTLALDEMTSAWIDRIRPDLIVSDSVAYWGKLVARKHHLPYVSSTTTFAFNRYSSAYLKGGAGETARMLLSLPRISRQLKRLRQRGYPVKSILDIVQNDNLTDAIVYTSKYFQPCSETFSERCHFVGPMLRPLERPFEKRAKKTVYISLGTVDRDDAFYKRCIAALGGTEYQAVFSAGKDPGRFGDVPPNVEIYESVDQMAVLSVSDAFVTHCGMNSASEALAYGVPLVLTPRTQEQGAVAKRTAELGAGVLLKGTGEGDILRAVNEVLWKNSYRECAGRVAASFRACGGSAEAVSLLEAVARRAGRK